MARTASIVLGVVVIAVAAGIATCAFQGGDRQSASLAVCAEVERHIRSGEMASAKRAAESARGRLPKAIALYLDAVLALAEGRNDDGRKLAEEAYASLPEGPEEWRVVSAVLAVRAMEGDLEGAWKAIDDYVRTHPTDERALLKAAQFLTQNQHPPDPEEALEYLDRIDALPARTVPEGDPTAIRAADMKDLRALAAQAKGAIAQAISEALDRVRLTPRDPMAHAALCVVYYRAGRYRESADACRKALELDPSNDLLRRQLAGLLLQPEVEGDPEEIDPLTQATLDAAPDDAYAQLLRARSLVRSDRYPEAKALYEAILARKDTPDEVRRDVSRNLAVLLYDWSAGGTQPEFLDEARGHLKTYLDLGGRIDARIRDMWDKLNASSEGSGSPGGGAGK